MYRVSMILQNKLRIFDLREGKKQKTIFSEKRTKEQILVLTHLKFVLLFFCPNQFESSESIQIERL